MTAGPPSHEGRDVSSNSVSAASAAAGGRWLLVFVTKMAKTGANQYQSKINEIAVTGN